MITINSVAEFEKEVLSYKGKVLVDFWATWCGPCKLVAPEVEKVEASLAGEVKFTRLDVNMVEEIALRYEVQGVPTLALFENGQEKDRIVGFRPAASIEAFLKK